MSRDLFLVSVIKVRDEEGSRPQFKTVQICADPFLVDFILSLSKRNIKHGMKLFGSPHEGYGVVSEEIYELIEAITKNYPEGRSSEAMDIAVAAYHLYKSEKLGYDKTSMKAEEIEQTDDIHFEEIAPISKGVNEFNLTNKTVKRLHNFQHYFNRNINLGDLFPGEGTVNFPKDDTIKTITKPYNSETNE